MQKSEKLFQTEEVKTREEVSGFLRALADKIESGSVSLRQGQQEVELKIPQKLELDIDVEQKNRGTKGIKQELEIELSWIEGDQGGPLELS